MPKETGLGWTTLNVDDGSSSAQDVRGDTTNFEFSTPVGVQDTTGVDKTAMERLLLLRDFSINLTGVFNDATDQAHDVFKSVPLANSPQRTITLAVSGQTLANECILTDYALSRGADGSLTWTVPGQLADGTVPTWS